MALHFAEAQRFGARGARALIILVLSCGLFVSPLPAQSSLPTPDIPPEVLNLARIKNRVRASLEELPNHTCRLNVRRAHLGKKARKKLAKKLQKINAERISADIPLDAADSVALDVAVVDGKELYAFPASPRFEERPLPEIVGFGTVSTGDFAGHARDIFVNGAANIRFAGEENFEGRRALRYDYEVTLFRSGLSVTNDSQTARVPYHGSFWAAHTNELLRLTVRADDIPSHVGVERTTTRIDYQSVRLAGGSFLMPREARLDMLLSSGEQSINETRFEDCKNFAASATLSFDEESARFYVTRVEEFELIDIPFGVYLPVRLETAIDSGDSRVGMPVEAALIRDVRFGGDSVLPKGARLLGRLRRLERYTGGDAHHLVGIEFRELVFGTKRADVLLSLERIVNTPGTTRELPAPRIARSSRTGAFLSTTSISRETIEIYRNQDKPGIGVFFVWKSPFRLDPGLLMTWRTMARPEREDQQQ